MSFWEVSHQQDEWFTTANDPISPTENIAQVEDKVPEIKVSIPDTKPVSMMPNVRDPVMGYRSQRRVGRGAFQSPEYNLAEIGRIIDTEGYVRQAFGKKTALMFKEGWDLVGKNPRTIKYVRTRLAQIAQATKIPTNTLFRNIGSSVISKSNAFLVKVRKTEASGGKIRSVPGKATSLKPVAGYFPLPAEAMKFKLEGSNVSKWKQLMPDGDQKEYDPKNVIHIHFDRKDGFIFGTPLLIPIIDDIRALRKIEENIEMLIYQHLFPLFQYKVGTETAPAGMNELGEREIDVVKREIMYMPTEGGIVTPERHEIIAIGSEGRALRAEGYLDHFKKRVFAGLGLSAVDYGEGDTANRATSDNMSRNLVDSVKDLQQIVEDAINDQIINELLLESTFGVNVLDEENIVKIKFKEIDVDAQIKKETHAADQFAKDVIDHDEARRRMGLEPWIVPSPDEVQTETDTPENYPQWHKSKWKMFELPKLLIQALDEPWSPIAKATAGDSSLPMTQQGNEQSTKEEIDREIQIEKEKAKSKAAVAKAKVAPPKKMKDGYLRNTFLETKKDVIERVSREGSIDHDWVASLIRTQMGTTIRRLQVDQLTAFRRGYSQIAPVETQRFILSASNARLQFQERAEHYVNRLTESIISSLRRNIHIDTEDVTTKTRAVFDALQYRTDFIEDVEIRKAISLGYVIAIRDTNINTNIVSQATSDDPCPTCKSRDGTLIGMNGLILDLLPPYHSSCSCILHRVDTETQFQNSVDESPPEQQVEQQEDNTLTEKGKKKQGKWSKFTKCKMKAATKLRERHPDWSEDMIQQRAEDICLHYLIDEKNIEDGTLEQCVLSVKKSLRKEHPDWSADKIKSSAFAICKSKRKGK